MTRFKVYLILAVVIAVTALIGFLYNSKGLSVSNAPEVDWNQLGELDYITGKGTDAIHSFDGKMVRIPGFMVPLEDNQKSVQEFLLVPTPQACIHVPPPPPNQMVLVEMSQDSDAQVEYGPIWIYGTLHIKSKRHMYGETSFTMDGKYIEPYR